MEKLNWFSVPPTVLPIQRLFGSDDVRVQLDSKKMLAEAYGWCMSVTMIAKAAGSVVPPWFWRENKLASYRDQDSQNYSFRELLDFEIPITVEGEGPDTLLAPCYIPTSGPPVMLDGNHRMYAMSKYKPDAIVVLIAAKGPADPAILPDLSYWNPS